MLLHQSRVKGRAESKIVEAQFRALAEGIDKNSYLADSI